MIAFACQQLTKISTCRTHDDAISLFARVPRALPDASAATTRLNGLHKRTQKHSESLSRCRRRLTMMMMMMIIKMVMSTTMMVVLLLLL